MRSTSNRSVGAAGRLTLVGIIACLSASCRFDTGFRSLSLLPLPNAPLTDLVLSDVDVVFEDEGTIVVYHGLGCAESNQRGTENIVRVRQAVDLPAYVTAATVFLNGWRTQYLRNDHELAGLFVSLGAIRVADGSVSWQVAGTLSDRNFDDGYRLCYYFTAIGWNSSNLAAVADHEDQSNHQAINPEPDNTTALKVIPGFLQDSSYPPGVNVALLPRGFGAEWSSSGITLPDHHLFQIAYNLDYAEGFVDSGKSYSTEGEPSLPSSASQVDFNVITRDSKAIFKDNSLRRYYDVGDAVSALMGADVGYTFSHILRDRNSGPVRSRRIASTSSASNASQRRDRTTVL